MNKKLIMTAAALLAFSTLAGCNVKTGSNSNSGNSNQPSTSSQEPDTNCTVTLDLNYDGAPAATTLSVEKGDYANAPADPVRDGYYFEGWYLDQEASGDAFDFVLTPITSDITLYAGWAAACDVTFYLNEPGKEQEVYLKVTVKSGTLVTQPDNPKITGWAFGGWFNTADCNEGDEFSFTRRVNSNKNAYAKWNEPNWQTVKDALDEFSSFITKVLGVEVPQFPNSDYIVDDTYGDALIVSGPDTCIAEYVPILQAAGYTVDTDAGVATNDYFKIEFTEDAEKGFEMTIFIADSGESTEFKALPYQVGTQQNYVGLPTAASSLFTKFYTYKSKLQGGGNCAVIDMNFEAKPEGSSQTDEEYWNAKVEAMITALKANGYNAGYFTNTGGRYFYDKAYLTMNQVEAYSESAPLKVEILAYSYVAQYGSGVSYNSVDAGALATAVSNSGWKPKITLNVDYSDIAAQYAVNKKNFITEYDADEDYIELDIFCVDGTSYTPLNALAQRFLESLDNSWDVMQQDGSQLMDKYYAYHYTTNASGKKVADAQLYFDYDYNSGRNVLGVGSLAFSVIIVPVEVQWNTEVVNGYFAKQALEGDQVALPAYPGEFAVIETAPSADGSYLQIGMLYTKAEEVAAYIETFNGASSGYSLVAADAEAGEYEYVSASGNFELYFYVAENSFVIVVDAAPLQEATFDAAGQQKVNGIVKARSNVEFGSDFYALLTANYTKIEFSSYFDFAQDAGVNTIEFITDIESVAQGQTNPVDTDITAIANFYKAQGYSWSSRTGKLTSASNTITVKKISPSSTNGQFFKLQLVVVGNPPEKLDDGHCTKINSTTYVADNGDAFLLGVASDALRNINATYYNNYCKGKVENSQLPSLYSVLGENASAYSSTTLSMTNLSSYDSALMYNYVLTSQFVDETEGNTILAAIKDAYLAALTSAGFVAASNDIWTTAHPGYWNAASGEFVEVSVVADSDQIKVDVYWIGKEMRNYILVA